MALRRALGLSDGQTRMPDDELTCAEACRWLTGLGAAFGAALGVGVGMFVHTARFAPSRFRRYLTSGAALGAAASYAHTRLLLPPCEPQNLERRVRDDGDFVSAARRASAESGRE